MLIPLILNSAQCSDGSLIIINVSTTSTVLLHQANYNSVKTILFLLILSFNVFEELVNYIYIYM